MFSFCNFFFRVEFESFWNANVFIYSSPRSARSSTHLRLWFIIIYWKIPIFLPVHCRKHIRCESHIIWLYLLTTYNVIYCLWVVFPFYSCVFSVFFFFGFVKILISIPSPHTRTPPHTQMVNPFHTLLPTNFHFWKKKNNFNIIIWIFGFLRIFLI